MNNTNSTSPTPERFNDTSAVEKALKEGVEFALRRHKRLGESIVVGHNKRVITLKAKDIPDSLDQLEAQILSMEER